MQVWKWFLRINIAFPKDWIHKAIGRKLATCPHTCLLALQPKHRMVATKDVLRGQKSERSYSNLDWSDIR